MALLAVDGRVTQVNVMAEEAPSDEMVHEWGTLPSPNEVALPRFRKRSLVPVRGLDSR